MNSEKDEECHGTNLQEISTVPIPAYKGEGRGRTGADDNGFGNNQARLFREKCSVLVRHGQTRKRQGEQELEGEHEGPPVLEGHPTRVIH